MIDPRDLAPEAFMERALALGVGPETVRRLLSAIVARGVHDPAAWGHDCQIPRRLIAAIGTLPRLELEHSVVSGTDGFQKLRFRTHDGLAVETVIIPLLKPGAVSICLSSQVGCVMGCQFCAWRECLADGAWKPGRSSTSSSTHATLQGARTGDLPEPYSWAWANRS